jgi:hypothetical protein
MLVVVDSDAILFELGEQFFLSASGAIGTCSIFVPWYPFPEANERYYRPSEDGKAGC